MNTNLTKQLRRKLLSNFRWKTFCCLTQASGCHLISLHTLNNKCHDTAQWKKKLNCVSRIHVTQSSFTESFLLVFSEVTPFSGYSKERFQTTFLRFHRNSDFKLLNPKNHLTVWDEYKHHKSVAQKASLQFSMGDISLLYAGLRLPLIISSQNITGRLSNWEM